VDLSERPRGESSPARRHPWELARYKFFARVLRENGLAPARVLDAGAGDGWFAQQLLPSLPSGARVHCWDAHYERDTLAALRRQADARISFSAERPREKFSLITLLDVLEHVEHDADFLGTLVRENLSPGGRVLISVPAWQPLFTRHDERLRHYRRYAPRAASKLIEGSGLTTLQRGGLFHALLAPRALEKARERLFPDAPVSEPSLDWNGGPVLTRAVDAFLAVDNRLSWLAARARLQLPGLSWWALCAIP
jgi:SAM-dependent methyltransferase